MNLLKILKELDDEDIMHINVWLFTRSKGDWNISNGRDVVGFLPLDRVKEAAEDWVKRHGLKGFADPYNVTRKTAMKLFGENHELA